MTTRSGSGGGEGRAGNEPVRCAVVGVGKFAEVGYLPALAASPDWEVVALCSRTLSRAERARESFGFEAAVSDRYQDVVAGDDVDAVVVAVPDNLHAEVVLAAARAGKSVLCEKPLTTSVEDALEVVREVHAHQVVGMVAHTFRYTLAVRRLAEVVASGAIGGARRAHMEVHWGPEAAATGQSPVRWRETKLSSPGGVWYDAGSHFVDLMTRVLGPPDLVGLAVSRWGQPGRQRPETPDLADVILSIEGTGERPEEEAGESVLATGTLSRMDSAGDDQLEVVGAAGAVRCRLSRGNAEVVDVRVGDGDWQRDLDGTGLPGPRSAPWALVRMVEAFGRAVRTGRLGEWDCSVEDALATQRVLEAGMQRLGLA